MRAVEPYLVTAGFVKLKNNEFSIRIGNNQKGSLLVYLPLRSEYYRLQTAFTNESGKLIVGPHSDPYGCPNSPNNKRYNFRLFRFHEDTYQRCAENIIEWIEDVALPWLQSKPEMDWCEGGHIPLPWPNQAEAAA
jgi:hypothetical protein